MPPILDPSAPGYGVFSIEGGLAILAAFLLLSCIHPATLLATRISGLALGRVPRRGYDAASAMTLTSASIGRGPALLPGYLLFLVGLVSVFFGTPANPAIFALPMPQAAFDPRIPAAAAIGLAALSGAYDSTPTSWGLGPLGGAGRFLRLAALGCFLAGCALTLSLSWAVPLLAAGIGARIVLLLAGRAVYLEGLGGLLLAPCLVGLWVLQTIVVSYIGPIERLLRPFLEEAGADGITFGLQRENALDDTTPGATLCASLDCVEGMKTPR